MKRLLLAAALAFICGNAQAQRESNVSGSKLLGFCTAKVPVNCDAYISGVADAIAAEGQAHAIACIPVAVTGTQLRDVLIKFLHDHPEKLQLKAGLLTTRAFAEAFACHR
jgi:hypothetical protein